MLCVAIVLYAAGRYRAQDTVSEKMRAVKFFHLAGGRDANWLIRRDIIGSAERGRRRGALTYRLPMDVRCSRHSAELGFLLTRRYLALVSHAQISRTRASYHSIVPNAGISSRATTGSTSSST